MNKRFTTIRGGFAGLCALVLAVGCGASVKAADESPAAGDTVTVRVMTKAGTLSDPVTVPRIVLDDAEWQAQLGEQQCYILREGGTERPFTGELLKNEEPGLYVCAGCNLPLFTSDTKFDSGTGWPSYFQPAARENVGEKPDYSLGMVRTEVVCNRCDGHLGHVFPDGPRPTGLRYCINSLALRFVAAEDLASIAEDIPVQEASNESNAPKVGDRLPKPEQDTALTTESGTAVAVFAGGCFWCTEAVFEQIDGVKDVVSGYAGGTAESANYKAVSAGLTDHAECVQITYDPAKVTYGQLMRIFFATHNPTEKNRQGPDVGTQYRSAIFYADDEQKALAAAYIEQLAKAESFSRPIATTLEPLDAFYEAEDYRQDFATVNPSHPYIRAWAVPKLEKLETKYGDYLRQE